MDVPEKYKIDDNRAVVFKNYFKIGDFDYNAVCKTKEGILFFDTNYYKTDGIVEVAVEVKEVDGGLNCKRRKMRVEK